MKRKEVVIIDLTGDDIETKKKTVPKIILKRSRKEEKKEDEAVVKKVKHIYNDCEADFETIFLIADLEEHKEQISRMIEEERERLKLKYMEQCPVNEQRLLEEAFAIQLGF